MIVNTASYCGYTSQFEGLEQIHQTYEDDGLVVLGFSSDDFFQEDNDEGDAAEVCFDKYEVSFPVIATSAVRGDDANPVFRGLGEAAGYPRWNFNKYLVTPDGAVLEHFASGVKPDSEEMRTAIESVLPGSRQLTQRDQPPCACCQRLVPLTFHHLIPKKVHRRAHFKRRFSKTELQRGVRRVSSAATGGFIGSTTK